tara:strand:- start:25 stop:519 length:495 start_codon:yes stop_codon:yes gene_type:complete
LDSEKNKIEKVKLKLIDTCKSFVITVMNNDHPDIGYAPYIYRDNFFYIFSSELSSHIRLLINKKVGTFMLIKDERDTKNIWARVRMKFQAKVSIIRRNVSDFQEITDLISNKHGNTIDIIREFKDFHLIKITPKQGTIITGFGSAYNLIGRSLEVTSKIMGNSK